LNAGKYEEKTIARNRRGKSAEYLTAPLASINPEDAPVPAQTMGR
jgi:hypothetical protein